MSTMKDSGPQSLGEGQARTRSRRKRETSIEPQQAFMQAFADALRDILRDEHRAAVA